MIKILWRVLITLTSIIVGIIGIIFVTLWSGKCKHILLVLIAGILKIWGISVDELYVRGKK